MSSRVHRKVAVPLSRHYRCEQFRNVADWLWWYEWAIYYGIICARGSESLGSGAELLRCVCARLVSVLSGWHVHVRHLIRAATEAMREWDRVSLRAHQAASLEAPLKQNPQNDVRATSRRPTIAMRNLAWICCFLCQSLPTLTAYPLNPATFSSTSKSPPIYIFLSVSPFFRNFFQLVKHFLFTFPRNSVNIRVISWFHEQLRCNYFFTFVHRISFFRIARPSENSLSNLRLDLNKKKTTKKSSSGEMRICCLSRFVRVSLFDLCSIVVTSKM